MTGDLCTAPVSSHYHPLVLADRRDWRDTRGNWPLALNPYRSWWHRHTTLKFFSGRNPWLYGQQVPSLFKLTSYDISLKISISSIRDDNLVIIFSPKCRQASLEVQGSIPDSD